MSPEEQYSGEHAESEDQVTNEDSDFKPKDYTYVIASARTISDHKQMLASENETEAATMLLKKDDSIKATIHLDTTSRSNIDGD